MSRTTFNSVTARYLLGLSAFLLGVAHCSNDFTVTLQGKGVWKLSCHVKNGRAELGKEDTKWEVDLESPENETFKNHRSKQKYLNKQVDFSTVRRIFRTVTLKNDKFESVETPQGFSGTTMHINLQAGAGANKILVDGVKQTGNTGLVFGLSTGQTAFKIQKISGGLFTKYKTLTLTFPHRKAVTRAPPGAATLIGYQTKNSHPIIAKWWCDKCNRDFMGNLPAHNNYKHEKSRVPKKCPKCHQDDVIDWDGKDRRRRRRLAPLERLLDAMQ